MGEVGEDVGALSGKRRSRGQQGGRHLAGRKGLGITLQPKPQLSVPGILITVTVTITQLCLSSGGPSTRVTASLPSISTC